MYNFAFIPANSMSNNKTAIAEHVASLLLSCGAVILQPEKPFTWASGWKSPIYCDNRITLSFPEIRKEITNLLYQVSMQYFPNTNAVAGVATGGIPQGVLLADRLDVPFLYIRSAAKEHGRQNQVEGSIIPDAKTLIIEDLISTGGSALSSAEALKREGGMITGMLAVFTYGFEQAEKAFADAGINLYTLSDFNTLIRIASQKGMILGNQIDELERWKKSPESWGK